MTADRAEWQKIAQSFETEHWRTAYNRRFGLPDLVDPNDVVAARKGLREVSRQIWENFGVPTDLWAGKTVLDIGPGPTGRVCILAGEWLAIDPLIEVYRDLPWSLLDQYRWIFDTPAEQQIDTLVGQMDGVVSLNCFDHCFDLPAILDNVVAYLKCGGLAFVSFDVDHWADEDRTHPIRVTHEEATDAILDAGLQILRRDYGHCYPGDPWRDNWGGGTAYHWWLRKPE